VSIPRDTWTQVPGYGPAKINAAFSYGGPRLYLQTIEQFTGLHIDHLAVIDWEGFKDLSTALGGVDVYVPRSFTSHGVSWQQGTQHLQGERALAYVRTRHGLPRGDLDRVARQQNFIRALMDKLVSQGTLANPLRLTGVVRTSAAHLILDSGFTNSRIRSLAFSLRHIDSRNVTFVTMPVRGFGTIDGQSVVLADRAGTKALFGAVAADELGRYVQQHSSGVLAGSRQVQ
jgi:LCP family protein required for cell wall assembly